MKQQKRMPHKDRGKSAAKDKELTDKGPGPATAKAENIKPVEPLRPQSSASEKKTVLQQRMPVPGQKTEGPQTGDLKTARPSDRPKQRPRPQKQESAPAEKDRAEKDKREKVFIEGYHLPGSYNTTTLTLMARDPFWIFAYWEIAPSSIEEVKNKVGGSVFESSRYVLRMYDVSCIDFNGKNANSWFDIEVGPVANDWYVSLWRDNVTYCGEIGIRTPYGSFFALARSNFVTTPRSGSSGRSELVWMDVKEDSGEPTLFITEPQAGETAGPSPVKKRGPEKSKGSGRKILLTEEDIKAYYSRLFPVLGRIILSRRQGEKSPYRIFLKYPLGEGGIQLEDLIIRGLSREEFIKKILLGSSEELILKGASEFVKEGASEREKREKKFFFDIGTELIVYGRTEPDAEVWLGNKKIELRQDGTFTLRFALPDGKIPLDFFARSADKTENRSMETSVQRTKTRYSS